MYDIECEVQKVTSGISEKFVSEPSKANALSDLIIGLKRFKNAIRWKEHFLANTTASQTNPEVTDTDNSSVESPSTSTINSKDSLSSNSSLSTNLKPKNTSKNAPIGSHGLEAFFRELEELLFARLENYYEKKTSQKAKSSTSSNINQLLGHLRKASKVAVPTDKTNSFKIIEIDNYKSQVLKHLDTSATEVDRSKLVTISEKAKELLSKVSHKLDNNEYNISKKQ